MGPLDLRSSDSAAVHVASTGASISYRRLLEAAGETGTGLGTTRSLLFLLCANDLFTATTYAAALVGEHPVALLDAKRPTAEIADLIRVYRPDWVAGPQGSGAELAGHGAEIERIVPVTGGELVRLASGPPRTLHPELAVLLSTSGTTGTQRFVRLSRTNVAHNASAIAGFLGLTHRDRSITSLPLHYTFGLSVLNSHWAAGASVVLTSDSVLQRTFWDTVRSFECTNMAGVPYTFSLLERVGFREMALPSLTTLQQAGGALDRRLTTLYAASMAQHGGRLFVMYGQTEATARMAYVPPERLADKLGSAGIAIPGGSLRIDPGSMDPHAGRPIGEVIYDGPNVMMGYASGSDDLAAGDTLGGTLRTGDIGYLDEESYLFLVGRSKRIAKLFGLRVNLDEVEGMVREHGPAVVVSDGDGLWAFCGFGDESAIARMRAELSRRLRVHPSGLHFRIVEEIPILASGKIDYVQVERWIPETTLGG